MRPLSRPPSIRQIINQSQMRRLKCCVFLILVPMVWIGTVVLPIAGGALCFCILGHVCVLATACIVSRLLSCLCTTLVQLQATATAHNTVQLTCLLTKNKRDDTEGGERYNTGTELTAHKLEHRGAPNACSASERAPRGRGAGTRYENAAREGRRNSPRWSRCAGPGHRCSQRACLRRLRRRQNSPPRQTSRSDVCTVCPSIKVEGTVRLSRAG